MSNDMVKKKVNVPAEWSELAENMLDRLSQGPQPLLKFVKGKYYVQGNEVPLGTQFVAYVADYQIGSVKFVNDQIVDKDIGRVADKFVPKERAELDDHDMIGKKDADGNSLDPWTKQLYLPVENVENGERFLFVSSSVGGEISVNILSSLWARRVLKGKRGLPTVELRVGDYFTKKYGRIIRPDFPVVSWDEDDIPMIKDITPPDKEGPPEDDPADPGWDLETMR
jgi:hypothetical protein